MEKISFTQNHRKQFQSLGVQAIYLFGSRALGHESDFSDYDYAVLIKNKGHSRGDETYFKLYEILSSISPRTLANDIIDIIFLRDAGLELKFHVIRHGRILYDDGFQGRLDFESETTLLYCDYRPVLDEFDHVLLESL